MRREVSRRLPWLAAVVLTTGAGLASLATPAHAAFPGKNGTIVHGIADALHVHKLYVRDEALQLTFGEPYDFYPTFSPDGSKIAYTRQFLSEGVYSYAVMVVNTDGSGAPRVVASSASFPGLELHLSLTTPAWSRDGLRISFVVRTGTPEQNGIWTVASGGSVPTRTVAEPYAEGLNASPVGGELAYGCRFRPERSDLCIYDELTNTLKQIPIGWPGMRTVSEPHWMPDGERIVFAGDWTVGASPNLVVHNDLFMVDANGGNLRAITASEGVCAGFDADTQAEYEYRLPRPSPDGASILASRRTFYAVNGDCAPIRSEAPIAPKDDGLYTVNLYGGGATLVVSLWDASRPPPPESNLYSFGHDWQPLAADLTVRIDDGHGHPLDALKVDVRNPETKAIVRANPIHTGEGTYVFVEVPAGDWIVRTTLVDTPADPAEPSAFEIWHAPGPAAAAWVEHDVTVKPEGGTIAYLPFDVTATLTDANVPASDRERLDDMAAIYYHLQRYVAWVKRTLTPQTGAKVIVHAFADFDPTDGTPVYSPSGAYYSKGDPALIVFGPEFSRYEFRDGMYDDGFADEAPENGEWHEFNHHLWFTFVDTAGACVGKNHAGSASPRIFSELPDAAFSWYDKPFHA
jgi:hypothetical protein